MSVLTLEPKYIVDEQGRPQEVIISWEQFLQIRKTLGLDLDDDAIKDLRQAQKDRAEKQRDAYVGLDAML